MPSMTITQVLFEIEDDTVIIPFFRTDDNVLHIDLAAELFTADCGTLVLRGDPQFTQDEIRVMIYVAEEE